MKWTDLKEGQTLRKKEGGSTGVKISTVTIQKISQNKEKDRVIIELEDENISKRSFDYVFEETTEDNYFSNEDKEKLKEGLKKTKKDTMKELKRAREYVDLYLEKVTMIWVGLNLKLRRFWWIK